MNVGDKVRAAKDLDGWAQASVPKDSVGFVTHTAFGRLDVTFTVAGVFGGTREVRVTVDPEQIAPTV
ncbi:hypothetical protein ACIBSV_30495 [Embleya sp. NPDC050154]|uniref:hypothetical protein n=1 Tax=unclassified Embleya TaxID=2699296 RepID=UPI00378A896C